MKMVETPATGAFPLKIIRIRTGCWNLGPCERACAQHPFLDIFQQKSLVSASSTAPSLPDDDRQKVLKECESRIGYSFADLSILQRGLTHSSCASTRLDCNERMEFLGDAVLGMVICEYIFQRYPEQREGQLTQLKSHLVSRSVCTHVGGRLRLEELIFVGKGLQTIPDSLKAAVVESVIAAIYLDGGLEPARGFILRAFAPELEGCGEADAENYKSTLQEETQREGSIVPKYIIIEERGPDHAREFQIAVEIDDRKFEAAWGRSKKEAEQKAAMHALAAINSEQPLEKSAK